MSRECNDWLETWERWTMPVVMAPRSYITWTGLFMMCTALKRKVCIPERYLGWICYPNIYVFLVGPAGMLKTAVMLKAYDIYEQISTINRTPQAGTQEAIMDMLAKQKDASLAIISYEFGNLYKNSEGKLIEFLTAAFDGVKVFDNVTLSRGHEVITNPAVNLLTATTPEWIAEKFTPAMLGGGFASRVIWLYEDKLRGYRLFKENLNLDALEILKKRLVHDLKHIESSIRGEFEIAESVREKMDEWFEHYMVNVAPRVDNRIKGYVQRKHKHILTVAMLLQISRSDELVIDIDIFNRALALVEQPEERLPTVFASVGKNKYVLEIEEIVNYIRMSEPVKRRQVLMRFKHIAEPEVTKSLLDYLQAVYERIVLDPQTDCYSLTPMERDSGPNGNGTKK